MSKSNHCDDCFDEIVEAAIEYSLFLLKDWRHNIIDHEYVEDAFKNQMKRGVNFIVTKKRKEKVDV